MLAAFLETRSAVLEANRDNSSHLHHLGVKGIQNMKRSKDWEAIKKIDFTLAYDDAVLGDGAVPQETARAVAVPTLVMNGGNSMDSTQAYC